MTRILQTLAIALFASFFLAEASGQTVANALNQVNYVRQSMGLYPLIEAPDLTAQAMMESTWRAYYGISGHLSNGVRPGRAEGVGNRGGADHWGRNFLTCFHSPGGSRGGRFFRRVFGGGPDYTTSYRYAGAAAAVSPNGETYYTLILR